MPERIVRLLQRRAIAHAWGVAPYEVDEAPRNEVELELQLMALEQESPGAASVEDVDDDE